MTFAGRGQTTKPDRGYRGLRKLLYIASNEADYSQGCECHWRFQHTLAPILSAGLWLYQTVTDDSYSRPQTVLIWERTHQQSAVLVGVIFTPSLVPNHTPKGWEAPKRGTKGARENKTKTTSTSGN